jgi:hypothetical protein
MKNKKTYYQIILDRSGSMSSCIEETVTGVNAQIRQIRELAAQFPEQELLTSFNLFNHDLTIVWDRLGATAIKELNYPDFKPDGTTALLDAVEIAITLNIRSTNSRHYKVEDSAAQHSSVSNSFHSYMTEKREGRVKQDFLEDDVDKKT